MIPLTFPEIYSWLLPTANKIDEVPPTEWRGYRLEERQKDLKRLSILASITYDEGITLTHTIHQQLGNPSPPTSQHTTNKPVRPKQRPTKPHTCFRIEQVWDSIFFFGNHKFECFVANRVPSSNMSTRTHHTT